MMRTEKNRGAILALAVFTALALLAPAVSPAQTTSTAPATMTTDQTTDQSTTTSDSSTTTTTSSTSTSTNSGKKTPATVDTTAVTSVGLNTGVTSIAADSNGNLYASLQYENKVVKLNGGGTEVARFTVGGNPTGLLVDNANGGFLYVLNNSDNTISKLKLDGTPVATFKVAGDGPVHAALYAGTLYVACERSNTLVRMSATDGTTFGSTAVGARPVWVTIAVTTTKYYYSSYSTMDSAASSDTMLMSDPATTDTTASSDPTMTTEPAPASDPTMTEETTTDPSTTSTDPATTDTTATSDPTMTDSSMMASSDTMYSTSSSSSTSSKTVTTVSIYVSCNKANQVWKLSNAGEVLARHNTARGPYGLALNSYGQLLVACFWDGVVMRINGSTGDVLSKTPVGDGAAGMIPYGSVVAVVENGNNGITRLSLADGAVISREKVDRSPLIGASNGSALWVSCTGSGTIAKRAL